MSKDIANCSDLSAGDLGDLPLSYPTESLATTLDRVVEFNRRFVHHRHESTHDLIALWVAHAYALPTWDYTGRLYITAPQPGCGKSTQAEVMAFISPDAVQTASASGPGLFRMISGGQVTLFIDEAENQFSPHGGRDKEIVTSVINSGYKRGAVVVRSEGNASVQHPVYAPVVIVGIDNGLLPDTTRSRCIPIRMVPGPNIAEKFRPRRHREFAVEVGARLSNSAMDWELHESDLTMRQGDLWESLLSVADAAGHDWPERALRALDDHQWADETSESAAILNGIHEYFESTHQDRVNGATLAGWLSDDDALAAISAKRLAMVLRGYEIKSRKSNGNQKYFKDDFSEAFETWFH
jgi:hypothetical protein